MDIQTLELLKNQAWTLRVKLNKIILSERVGRSKITNSSVRKKRLSHAHARAYARFLRREDKFIIAKAMIL